MDIGDGVRTHGRGHDFKNAAPVEKVTQLPQELSASPQYLQRCPRPPAFVIVQALPMVDQFFTRLTYSPERVSIFRTSP